METFATFSQSLPCAQAKTEPGMQRNERNGLPMISATDAVEIAGCPMEAVS
jgi:hypothetical protein